MMNYMSRGILLVISPTLIWASTAVGNELSGRVLNFKGEPIAGATVFVSTAAPREGVAIFCPSCYLDCGKKATSDAEGRFTIAELDPSLVFYLVATADGYRTGQSRKTDPAKDRADIQLEPLPAELPPDRVLRGRVVDAEGKPVVGAEVRPFGCQTANRRWWGSTPGVDAVSISNGDGEFIITSREPAEAFDLEVRSPRHAARNFALQPTGEKPVQLMVETGGIVRGRLLRDGKPVAGVSIGLVQTDRSSGTFLDTMVIGTDAEGKFQFTFVPPNDEFYIYSTMGTMKGQGALPVRRVSVGKSSSLIDLDDMAVGPSYTLSGRVVLTDGKSLREPVQLIISREGAWDSQTAMIKGDGQFRFDDVPGDEPLSFVARVPGYQLASGRNRFQQVRENSIAMFVEGPRQDVDIFYEPVADTTKK